MDIRELISYIGVMETRAELNARLMLAGMPKGVYAKFLGMTPQTVSRHGHAYRVPAVADALIRAWEIMSAEQRSEWMAQNGGSVPVERQNGGPK